MRSAAALSLLALLTGSIAAASPPASDSSPAEKLGPASGMSGPLVLAHRGCWGEAPEVSVAAIEACAGTGVDGVEIDIRKTRDGALVLMHDETVDRTTDGTGVVAEMTLKEIRGLRLRKGAGGPGVAVTEERVPTLEQGLRTAKGRFFVHLDTKTASLAEMTVVVRRTGMEGQVSAWLRGAPGDMEAPGEGVAETIALVPVVVECTPEHPPCRSARPDALDAYARFRPAGYFLTYRASRSFLTAVAAAKRPTGTWIATETLGRIDNSPRELRQAEWRDLVDRGVTMILTDRPFELAAFRQALLKR